MSFDRDIAAIQLRIAQALLARDTCRAAGRQEKYMEACSTVEACELELDRLRKQGVRSLAQFRAKVRPPKDDPGPDRP